MEIVYCGDCGKSLRRDDFSQGKAHYLNDVPYCTECRPVQVRQASSGTLKKLGTTRMPRPAVPPTARYQPRPRSSRLPLVAGGVLAGIAFLVLLGVVRSGGKERTPEGGAAKAVPPREPGTASRPAEADLEKVRQEERDRQARQRREEEAQRQRDRAQLESLLGQAKAIREADPKFARSDEVAGLLKSALDVAGPRRAEVERIRAEYEKALGEAKQKALGRRKGPYELDGSGRIQNWLILGPFPNGEDKEFYTDYLKTEEQHEPAEGLEVGKARWAPYAVEGGMVNFFQVTHLGLSDRQENIIEYAACWLECDRDMEVEIRLGSDDGFRLWVDGEVRMTRHVHRGVKEDEDSLPLKLGRGLHLVLLKVDQGDGDHGFVARVVTPQGERPSGIRVWN